MKPYLVKTACLWFLCMFSATNFCQTDFITGYIIDLQGDTARGFIDFKETDVNPYQISFKTDPDQSPVIFYPTTIKGFAVHSGIYEGAVVTVDEASNKTEDIDYFTGFKPRTDNVFLQTIIQGVKSLYYYFDMTGKEHFFIKNGAEYELLYYKKYKVMKDDAIGIAYNRKYLQQLSAYFQDCPEILSRLEGTEYSKKDLIDLFSYYYDCVNAEIEFQKEKEKYSLEYGLFAGLSITKINFISISFPYLTEVDYPPLPFVSGGVFFNILLPGRLHKYSFNNEFFFTSYKVSGQYDEFVNENDYTITNTSLGYSYLKMNNMFRFTLPVRKLSFYINAGMSNGYAITEKNYKKKTVKAYTMLRVTEEEAIPSTQRYEQGFLLGLGSRLKDFSFEIRYEIGNGMSKHAYLRSNASRLYFLLGYKF